MTKKELEKMTTKQLLATNNAKKILKENDMRTFILMLDEIVPVRYATIHADDTATYNVEGDECVKASKKDVLAHVLCNGSDWALEAIRTGDV